MTRPQFIRLLTGRNPPGWRLLICLAGFACHAGGFIVLYRWFGRTGAIVLSLEPIVIAFMVGLRGGIFGWLLCVLLINPLLFLVVGVPFRQSLVDPPNLIGSMMTLVLVLIVGRLNDLERRVRDLNDRLYRQSRTDELTDLLNRRAMLQMAEHELKRAGRAGSLRYFSAVPSADAPAGTEAAFKAGRTLADYVGTVSFAMIDLDHFKRVNDTWGHAAGDEVLRAFAAALRSAFRETDFVGRFGGEEFLVILPDTSAANAFIALRHLAESFSRKTIKVADSITLQMTFSCGIAELNDQRESVEEIITRADTALYLAKEGGRNQTVLSGIPQRR